MGVCGVGGEVQSTRQRGATCNMYTSSRRSRTELTARVLLLALFLIPSCLAQMATVLKSVQEFLNC